jgi:hypothetical protein
MSVPPMQCSRRASRSALVRSPWIFTITPAQMNTCEFAGATGRVGRPRVTSGTTGVVGPTRGS